MVIARKVEVVAASKYRAVEVVAGMKELLRAVVELFLVTDGESLRVEPSAKSGQELNLFVCLGPRPHRMIRVLWGRCYGGLCLWSLGMPKMMIRMLIKVRIKRAPTGHQFQMIGYRMNKNNLD